MLQAELVGSVQGEAEQNHKPSNLKGLPRWDAARLRQAGMPRP
jgi:hypothetical protein